MVTDYLAPPSPHLFPWAAAVVLSPFAYLLGWFIGQTWVVPLILNPR